MDIIPLVFYHHIQMVHVRFLLTFLNAPFKIRASPEGEKLRLYILFLLPYMQPVHKSLLQGFGYSLLFCIT